MQSFWTMTGMRVTSRRAPSPGGALRPKQPAESMCGISKCRACVTLLFLIVTAGLGQMSVYNNVLHCKLDKLKLSFLVST